MPNFLTEQVARRSCKPGHLKSMKYVRPQNVYKFRTTKEPNPALSTGTSLTGVESET
jgi:hypothetical protein